jgi:5'-nucleotidase
MPNDAKFGLVVGVALVLTVAVVFFRKEGTETDPATSVRSTPPVTTKPPPPRPALARVSARPTGEPSEPRRHVVQEGDTLFRLAQHYYGDGTRFLLISQHNQQEQDADSPLPVGAELEIPAAGEER